MNKEFKKINNGDTTRYVLESASGGGTSAGSVASVSKPIGGVQRRDNLLVQDANQKLTPRSPVAHAAQKVAKGSGRHTDRKQQSKQVRGEKHKNKDFAENQDHEINMAGSELHSIFQNAKQLHSMIKTKSEEEGLDAWQQSKITKAADYLNSVLQSLQHEMMGEGWSQKYKNSINCSHPKGFSQRAHCAGKRKHNESVEMEMTCPDCGMCRTHGNNMMEVKQRLDAKCWKGKHKEGTKIKGGIRVNNCVSNEGVAEGLISSGDAALELLELNIFKDLIGEHSLSNYDEEFAQSPKWQKVVAKWAPKAEGLYNAVIRLHNLGKKISSQEARAITDTAYDGSDAYNDPESAASDLPRIYAQQYNAILQFIENLSNPKPNTIHEQGMAEGEVIKGPWSGMNRPELGEKYVIIRTKPDGEKDFAAGSFDSWQRAKEELQKFLDHPLHTKFGHKFEIVKKKQGVAEGDDRTVANIKNYERELAKYKKFNANGAHDVKIKNLEKIIAYLKSKQGVAEGLPQTLRKVVPGYAKREIDKKMDAGKFGKTDADKDANFQRYKKIQDKLKDQGVAEGLNEFAPDGFGGDDGDGFDPDMAKMAHEEGFTKGVSLAMVATLERAMEIGHWHKRHGGMYKHYFAKGFKEGRLARIRHDNKQYDLNLQLNKDGSVSHGEQDMAEAGPFSYGKPPRKGSVADLAAKRRQEQDRKTPPIEPKDQMVGNAKVITKDVKERYDEWDEGDVMYRWDDSDGTIRKRSILHARRRESLNQGWRDSVEQVLRDQNIIRSKFNPNKWIQKQGSKWIQVFPFGQDGVAESQLAELDRPSGKLFIIVKADNAGATHVFGDFGSFPQDVMHKISKRGTRDKSGAKTKLKIDFLFNDFRSTIQQLRTIFRDVDFVGAEAAEFIIHSSALRSDQGEDVKHLRDYIENGDDRRMKIYQAPEDDEEDDGETTGGNMLRIDPETGAARKVVGVKPQTQMGGKSAEQPGMTTYRFKDPRFAQQLRGMNLGFNIKGDSITVDQKQKAKLVSMLGNKFGDIFTSQERFKEEDAVEAMLPKSAFAGSDKNKLGPAAHLKGSMKRPAKAGDLVGGDAQESLELSEKAVSQQQQKFFGMVHAMQKGKKIPGASAELKKTAKSMSKSDAKDFAKTKHAGLPKKVSEFKMELPPARLTPDEAKKFAADQQAKTQAMYQQQQSQQSAQTLPQGAIPGRNSPHPKTHIYDEKLDAWIPGPSLLPTNEDTYMESLSAALEQKLSVNDTPEVWRDDFVNADPVKYKQFRNKTDEKKRHMADVARYNQIQKK